METIILSKEEIKKIKKDFFNGGVMTDGCFCGEAVSNFRDNLYVMINFSCRKSGSCKNDYYQVHNVYIGYNGEEKYPKGYIKQLSQLRENADFYFTIKEIEGYKLFEDDTWNIYLIDDTLKFDNESLRKVQKQLFKYYKENFYCDDSLNFNEVGNYEYKDISNDLF